RSHRSVFIIAGFPPLLIERPRLRNELMVAEHRLLAAPLENALKTSLLLLAARRYLGNRNRIAVHVAGQTDSLPGVFRESGKLLVRDVVNLPAGNKNELTTGLDARQRAIPVGHLSVFVLLHHFCVAGTARAIANHSVHRHIGGASQ